MWATRLSLCAQERERDVIMCVEMMVMDFSSTLYRVPLIVFFFYGKSCHIRKKIPNVSIGEIEIALLARFYTRNSLMIYPKPIADALPSIPLLREIALRASAGMLMLTAIKKKVKFARANGATSNIFLRL